MTWANLTWIKKGTRAISLGSRGTVAQSEGAHLPGPGNRGTRIEDGDRLRADSTRRRRGGPERRVKLDRNRVQKAYEIRRRGENPYISTCYKFRRYVCSAESWQPPQSKEGGSRAGLHGGNIRSTPLDGPKCARMMLARFLELGLRPTASRRISRASLPWNGRCPPPASAAGSSRGRRDCGS